MKSVRVLSVVSEIYPLIKTGGLADVPGALPIALKAEGIDTRTLVPGYPAVMGGLERVEQLLERSFFGDTARTPHRIGRRNRAVRARRAASFCSPGKSLPIARRYGLAR